jgi:hypothetical protein
MQYFKKLILLICALLVNISVVSANVSQPTDARPEYIVTYELSKGLESPQFLFTEQAFKLIPPYLKTSSSLPIGMLDKRNLITIRNSKPGIRYCEKSKEFCWPKVMELDGTYIRFTSYEGTRRFALDTSNLHRTLWNAFYDDYKKSH